MNSLKNGMGEQEETNRREPAEASSETSPDAPPTEEKRQFPVGISLSWKRKNLDLAGIVLLVSCGLLALSAHDLWTVNEAGQLVFRHVFLLRYIVISLWTVVLCFVKIRLPELVRRIFGWIAVTAVPWAIFYMVDLINNTGILDFSRRRLNANYLCYLLIFALIYALCRRGWLTTLIGGGIYLFFGIANYFVIQFRGKPILPWDIQALGTAFEVSGEYHYAITCTMVFAVMLLALLSLLCYRLEAPVKKWGGWKLQAAERGCALVLFAVLAFQLFPCDLLTDMGISVWAWNQTVSSQKTGVMAGFFANIQFLMVNKPDNYSAAAAKKLGETIDTWEEPSPLGDPEKEPTIIVVMSESLTDLQNVGTLKLDEDCQPFLHSLQERNDVIHGTAYSSVYGGDTCNSEYEFLTGNTLGFLPTGSKPYQQYVDHEQTALPSLLKGYGYTCTALHPGNANAWHRDTAFPYLGFDTFLSAHEYTFREKEHGLTSDRSHYRQIIQEFENREEGERQFLFTVSIQNHGGYEKEDYPSTVKILQVGNEVQDPTAEPYYPQAEQYLTMLERTDEATEEFFRYFEEQQEPVLILLFGDHWPNLEPEFAGDLLQADTENMTITDLMREYEVPFVIWANYPLEGYDVGKISLNYLSGLLLRAAGLEGTAYTKFLEHMRQEIPVITAIGTMDQEGALYRNGNGKLIDTPTEEVSRWLSDYAILQYNNAFGGEGKQRAIFTGKNTVQQ